MTILQHIIFPFPVVENNIYFRTYRGRLALTQLWNIALITNMYINNWCLYVHAHCRYEDECIMYVYTVIGRDRNYGLMTGYLMSSK